jgi:urease accessory protein
VTTAPALATLLVLVDGRFPSGGHAHSGGVEAAVLDGRIRGHADLARFLDGRLATGALGEAALAAATALATVDPGPVSGVLARLDAECVARTPSPALRTASRRQGRQLWRAATRVWPGAVADRLAGPVLAELPDGASLPLACGLAATTAGLGADAAAMLATHGAVTGAATAAVRLLGLDPYAVHGLVAERARAIAAVVDDAVAAAADAVAGPGASSGPNVFAGLPAPSAVLVDLAAEVHRRTEVRLFAS